MGSMHQLTMHVQVLAPPEYCRQSRQQSWVQVPGQGPDQQQLADDAKLSRSDAVGLLLGWTADTLLLPVLSLGWMTELSHYLKVQSMQERLPMLVII